jgi:branched-chain amino acid aminotransferase
MVKEAAKMGPLVVNQRASVPKEETRVPDIAALSQRQDVVVYLNGQYIPGSEARVGVMTHALAYGTGVFEGIRGYWNQERDEVYLFRLRDHFERMHQSARIMDIHLPYSVDQLMEIAVELVRRNSYHENVYVRPFAYKADEIIGVRLDNLHDHFTMYCVPMGDYVSTAGLRCGVSSWRRVDDNMIPARAKVSGAYVNSALAKTEATKNGFDEAIMLSNEGHVCEGSAENLFALIGDELVTPPPSENILVGVTRDTVMRLAKEQLSKPVRERVIDRTELYIAREVFLTGTGAQIAPVVEIDHRPVGTGRIGPIAEAIQRLYADVVRGRRAEYQDWLQPCHATAAQPTTAKVAAHANGHANGHNGHGKNGHAATRATNGANGNGAHAANGTGSRPARSGTSAKSR